MANFLNIENLTKSYGDRLLMDDLTFGVDEGDKIGIVAKNGTGKSTLLRMLAGTEAADSGKITFRNGVRVAFLEQLPEFSPGLTVLDAALDSDDELAVLVRRYEESIAAGNGEATAEIAHEMDSRQAWDYLDRMKQTLTMLGINDLGARMEIFRADSANVWLWHAW